MRVFACLIVCISLPMSHKKEPGLLNSNVMIRVYWFDGEVSERR